eukprot:m.39613 g.39613  ORF g.39613 m.39613 type:complete len:1383 (+) comp32771_c0_seq5:3-4151(+)
MTSSKSGQLLLTKARINTIKPKMAAVESVQLDKATQKEVKRILAELLDSSPLERVLGNILLPLRSQESLEARAMSDIKALLTRIPPESYREVLSLVFDYAVSQKNVQRLIFLLGLLVRLAENSVFPHQFVFDLLIDRLDFSEPVAWMETFGILLTNIKKTDYRACRELLVRVLSKVSTCPVSIPRDKIALIKAAKSFVSQLLNRDEGLLPGYSAYSAIAKRFPEGSPTHWIFEDMWESFRDSFQLLADLVTVPGRSLLRPVVGFSPQVGIIWRVDSSSLQFLRKSTNVLVFNKEESQAQSGLLNHALSQPSSRELVCLILNLSRQNRQRCAQLEDALTQLIFQGLKYSEEDPELPRVVFLWNHLCSQMVFFALFQFASLSNLLRNLADKLSGFRFFFKKGRDWLMWLLLQVISPSIQKLEMSDCECIFCIFETLYSNEEAVLPIPDFSGPHCVISMAAACIWNHLHFKFKSMGKLPSLPALPACLKQQTEFFSRDKASLLSFAHGYQSFVIVCNAYGGIADTLSPLAGKLVDQWQGSSNNTMPMPSPSNLVTSVASQPCSVDLLKSLTTNIRMNLLATVNQKLIKPALPQQHVISPAFLEAYSRLIVYMETDYGVAVKTLTGQVLPSVYQQQNWNVLHSLVEVMSFRLQRHISVSHKVQLLTMLYQLSSNANYQLHLSIETAALKFLMSLITPDFPSQLLKLLSDQRRMSTNQLLSPYMEELNKVFVLTLAKSTRIAGLEGPVVSWIESIMKAVQNMTPHSWPAFVTDKMPSTLRNCYANLHQLPPSPLEQKPLLLGTVAEDWTKWKSQGVDEAYFSKEGGTSTFLCILWKMLVEESKILPNVYRILDRMSVKELVAQTRMLADYITAFLASSLSKEAVKDQFNKSSAALNELIWKYRIIPLERFILCMLMRNASGGDAHVQITFLNILLTNTRELKERIVAFLQERINPDHWKHDDWFQKNVNFHKAYPDYMYFEGVQSQGAISSTQKTYFPTYFGNSCLRFIPILELMVNRCFELSDLKAALKLFDRLMDLFGGLYRYHDRPVMSVYTLLHYHDRAVGPNYAVKKKLVASTLGVEGYQPNRNWHFTRPFRDYLAGKLVDPFPAWTPDLKYFSEITTRLQSALNNDFPIEYLTDDWRFREFGSPALHILYSTCIEVMALPLPAREIGQALITASLRLYMRGLQRMAVFNATAVLLTGLPESYWGVVSEKLLQCIPDVVFVHELDVDGTSAKRIKLMNPISDLDEFGFTADANMMLRLASAFWHHSTYGQLMSLISFLEKANALVKSEAQLLFVFRLIGPLLSRFQIERTSSLLDIALGLYRMLKSVDTAGGFARYLDLISDFLYYIKYSFIGDAGKEEIKAIVASLNPESPLYMRLRFMIT